VSRLNLPGLVPAVVTPFDDLFQLDELALRGLVRKVLTASETVGVLVNGVAGEVEALSRQERERVIAITAEEASGKGPVIAGIEAATPSIARSDAERAAASGAAAVLLQAPAAFARGIAEAPDVALRYVREVARAEVPIFLFQHQFLSQRAYPLPLLLQLLEIENVIGIKETIWDVARYEQTVTAVRRERPDALVMLANDTLLLPCLVSAMPDGMMLGFASLAGEEISQLWRSVKNGRLDEARRLHSMLAPIRDAVYAPPGLAYYPRLKAGLQVLGLLPNRNVRPPLVTSTDETVEQLRAALFSSSLLASTT
jgi:4-hydroxy-tetrahydrodipicolinate synthase